MSQFIPLCVPSFKGNEWTYVKECIDTEWVSSAGKYVDKFESDIARFVDVAYAVACVNGTAALHICLLLAGVGAEDEVVVPTTTFIAPINVVTYVGATPVFMDCDEYYNIDIEKTLEFLKNETEFVNGVTINKKSRKRIRAILPVHVFGNAVPLASLIEECQKRNIIVIEDATESLGTRYTSGPLANRHTGTVGDFGCVSFNGNKIITTGGGGMILFKNEELAKKAKYLTTQAKDDEIRYVHHEVGYNYRLTNLQAALGVAQLEQLPQILEKRHQDFAVYQKAINEIPGLHLAEGPSYSKNNHWMFALQIDAKTYGKDREELMAFLQKQAIQTRPLWYLNHIQKPFQRCQAYKIEKASKLLENTLNIPCSFNLSEAQIQRVIEALKNGAKA